MTGWAQHEAEVAEDKELAAMGKADATLGSARRSNNPAYRAAYRANLVGHRPGHLVYGYGQQHLDGYGCRGCGWETSNNGITQQDAEAIHDREMHLEPYIFPLPEATEVEEGVEYTVQFWRMGEWVDMNNGPYSDPLIAKNTARHQRSLGWNKNTPIRVVHRTKRTTYGPWIED